MKIIKKIIIICIIFLLAGCSVDYDLTINEDNSVNEKVIASENTNRMMALTNQKEQQSINYLYNIYKGNRNDVNLITKNQNGDTIITAVYSYPSIDDYVSNFSSDLFENINITKKDGIVTLVLNQKKKIDKSSSKSLIYDDVTINIHIPFKIVESNADSSIGDTYKWVINKDTDLKQIKISYDENKQKNKIHLKIKDKTLNINYGLVIGSVIILLVFLFIAFIFVNNKKNNTF